MIPLLPRQDPTAFPDLRRALRVPNGLLAAGGDLSPERLEQAYRRGIFPWFGAGDPILWWSPDPRTLLFPERLRIGRSLRKRLRQRTLAVTLDREFAAVIRSCAEPAPGREGTWILPEMIAAYERLHTLGLAHSVEVWDLGGARAADPAGGARDPDRRMDRGDGASPPPAGVEDAPLVGGLYGVAIGRAFFGESMFSRVADASKVALVHLCRQLADWGFGLIDCQMRTEHLLRLGAIECPRAEFARLLQPLCAAPGRPGSWDDGQRHFPADRLADRPGEANGPPPDGAPPPAPYSNEPPPDPPRTLPDGASPTSPPPCSNEPPPDPPGLPAVLATAASGPREPT